MKKLLILLFSLTTIFGYSQTNIDPSLTPTTARINAAIADAVATSGTDTYTGTKSGLTNVTDRAYSVKFTNANTGIATFNLNAAGAVTIRKFESGSLVNLVAGDIAAGETKRLRYNGTYLVIEGGSGSSVETGTVEEVTGTSPIVITSTPTTTPNVTINNSAADGSTKGAASFTANDFDASSGNISIDYTNGQAASGSTKGFLTSADWTTFNSKQSALTLGTGVQTWLATPSYSNLTSALTGTSPWWLTASGAALLGVNTISSTTPSGLIFSAGHTTTASDQFGHNFGGTIVPRATASDNIYGGVFNYAIDQKANGQSLIGVQINPSFTNIGGFSATGQQNSALLIGTKTAGLRFIPGSSSTMVATGGLNLGSSNSTTLAFANGGTQIEFGASVSESSSSVTINNNAATTSLGNGILYLKTIIGNAASNGGTYYGLNSSGAFTNNWANNSTFFGASFRNAITANGAGTSSVTLYHARPTINATAGTTTVSGYTYDPIETSLTGVTHYGFRSTSTTALSAFGLSTPTATLHVLGTIKLDGSVTLPTAGNGILIKEGTNATMGAVTLVAGTAVVSTTKVTASSRIMLTRQDLGTITIPVGLAVSARTVATSFTILSGDLTDTSLIAWQIIEPAP